MDSLLALKDLVIDNDRAVDYLRDLHNMDDSSESLSAGEIALNGIPSFDLSNGTNSQLALGGSQDEATSIVSSREPVRPTLFSEYVPAINGDVEATTIGYLPHDQLFDSADRYEHALRRLSLIRWERDRLANIRQGLLHRSPHDLAVRAAKPRSQLESSMSNFGMDTEQIDAALEILDMYPGLDSKTRINCRSDDSDYLLRTNPTLRTHFVVPSVRINLCRPRKPS